MHHALRFPVALLLTGLAAAGCGDGSPLPGSNSVPLVHRPTAPICPSTRPAFGCSVMGSPAPSQCSADADCKNGTNGRCAGNPHDGCNCSYDLCKSDADCPTGQLCDCRGAWHYGENGPNRCLPSNCRLDADCGPKGYCSPTLDPQCGSFIGVTGWYCHTSKDECRDDADCKKPDGGFAAPFCAYHPEVGHWACSSTACAG